MNSYTLRTHTYIHTYIHKCIRTRTHITHSRLQTKRHAAEAAAREEAELFLANELSKQPAEPITEDSIQVNGFVFSIQTLFQEMAWHQTLAEARWYKSQNWNRTKQPPFALLTFPKAA